MVEVVLSITLIGFFAVLIAISITAKQIREGKKPLGKGWFLRSAESLNVKLAQMDEQSVQAKLITAERSAESVDERTRSARRKRLKAEAEMYASQPEVDPSPLNSSFDIASFAGDEYTESVREALNKMKAGLIDLTDFEEIAKAELEAIRTSKRDWRDDYRAKIIDDVDRDEAIEQLNSAALEIRDMLNDASYQSDRGNEARDARWSQGESGKWARFTYTNAEGDASDREIVNWQSRGAYVVGYDRSRGAERTFRKSRIEAWLSRPL